MANTTGTNTTAKKDKKLIFTAIAGIVLLVIIAICLKGCGSSSETEAIVAPEQTSALLLTDEGAEELTTEASTEASTEAEEPQTVISYRTQKEYVYVTQQAPATTQKPTTQAPATTQKPATTKAPAAAATTKATSNVTVDEAVAQAVAAGYKDASSILKYILQNFKGIEIDLEDIVALLAAQNPPATTTPPTTKAPETTKEETTKAPETTKEETTKAPETTTQAPDPDSAPGDGYQVERGASVATAATDDEPAPAAGIQS